LRTGDRVLVWDGRKERNIWQRIAQIEVSGGRLKLRVEGTPFFFDEALVISYAALAAPGDAGSRAGRWNFPERLLRLLRRSS
jgi:hypothetical protein